MQANGNDWAPINFGNILGQGKWPLTSWALAVSGITEKKPEEKKPQEKKPEEKKPHEKKSEEKDQDEKDAKFKKWFEEALKEEEEEEKKKKEDLALALQKLMSGEESGEATSVGNLLGDQAFKSSILASLLGADPNDPAVKPLLASLSDESKRNEEEESSSKGEDEKK